MDRREKIAMLHREMMQFEQYLLIGILNRIINTRLLDLRCNYVSGRKRVKSLHVRAAPWGPASPPATLPAPFLQRIPAGDRALASTHVAEARE